MESQNYIFNITKGTRTNITEYADDVHCLFSDNNIFFWAGPTSFDLVHILDNGIDALIDNVKGIKHTVVSELSFVKKATFNCCNINWHIVQCYWDTEDAHIQFDLKGNGFCYSFPINKNSIDEFISFLEDGKKEYFERYPKGIDYELEDR